MAARGRRAADVRLLAALAGGATMEDAAAAAGVSERTAYRRLAEPAFRQELSRLRGQMMERAAGRLADSAAFAARTLEALLQPDTPAAVRLGAARAILALAPRLREQMELEERIRALERSLDDREAA